VSRPRLEANTSRLWRESARVILVKHVFTPIYYATCQIYILNMSIVLAAYCVRAWSLLNSVGELKASSVKAHSGTRPLASRHTAKNINWTLNRIRVSSHNRHSQLKSVLLWEMTPYNPPEVHRRFRGTQLSFLCRRVNEANNNRETSSKDGGNTFLRNVGKLLTDFMASSSKIQHSSLSPQVKWQHCEISG
jgi:hypothetical protein